MKKSLLALSIAAGVAMTGCEDKQTTEKLQNAEKTAVQLQNALNTAQSEIDTLKTDLAKAQQNQALQVEIVKVFEKSEEIKNKPDPEGLNPEVSSVSSVLWLPKTNLEWLNALLVKEAYSRDEEQGRTLQNPTEADLKQSREKLFQDMVESVKETPVPGYEDNIYGDFIGQRHNIAGFTMTFSYYSGGAHGMYYTRYINVDLNKKAIIGLNDLISPQNQEKAKTALWDQYAMSRTDEKGEYNGFGSRADFRISPEFYFNQHGVTFVYPPYELGSFAEGNVEVTLDWYLANQLINADYQRGEKDGFMAE